MQKPKGLLITRFKLGSPFSACTVCAGRTASIAGIVHMLSVCATIRATSSNGMASTVVDIDEGKRAEDALRRNEDELRRSEAYLAEAQIG